ncbi:MAG: phage tail tape measure protein [Methanofastidiosum sp.]
MIGNVIMTVIRGIRDSITFIKELDKDLTEISMITGMTRTQTRELANEYARFGKEMGKTVMEISAVNKELIRQGLSLDIARQRMEAILKLSSTARISTEQSLEIITSSVNAMKESVDVTTDTLLKAGAVSASSAAQIGEAFTKTASSAKATGVSIQNLTSMLATMIEITQESPSSLGNSMKTLLARFNKVNEETGELNTEINQVQKAFESVGVTFFDLEGQIRPVDELLAELNEKWPTLDKNTKMYIATQAAGVRQQNRLEKAA